MDTLEALMFPVRDELPGAECWLLLERSPGQEPKAKYYVGNAGADCVLSDLAGAVWSKFRTCAIDDSMGRDSSAISAASIIWRPSRSWTLRRARNRGALCLALPKSALRIMFMGTALLVHSVRAW